jgi:hypothetical protein
MLFKRQVLTIQSRPATIHSNMATPSTQTDWKTISALRIFLAITWYRLAKYQKLGVVPLPDGFQNGRPMWREIRFPAIKTAVDAYEEGIRQAERNELQAQRQTEREAEEARKARTRDLSEMFQRRAEQVGI